LADAQYWSAKVVSFLTILGDGCLLLKSRDFIALSAIIV